MDLHELDVLINDAGQQPTAINTAIVAALANDVPFAAIRPVLEPLAKLSVALQKIQQWSNAAKANPVLTVTDASQFVDAHKGDKLPQLAGDLRTRLLREVLIGQHDSTLDADPPEGLGGNHNAYKNAYGVGGYYYHPDNFKGL